MRYCSKVTPFSYPSPLRPPYRADPLSLRLLRTQTCQMTAWPSHKAECRGLSSLRAAYSKAKALSGGPKVKGEWIPHEGVRALARLAVERRGKREKNEGKDDLWVSSLLLLFLSLPPGLPAFLSFLFLLDPSLCAGAKKTNPHGGNLMVRPTYSGPKSQACTRTAPPSQRSTRRRPAQVLTPSSPSRSPSS